MVSNINTGEMFLLPSGSDGLVHELSSGRSISFDEFEAKIGLHPEVADRGADDQSTTPSAQGISHRRSSSNDTADSHGYVCCWCLLLCLSLLWLLNPHYLSQGLNLIAQDQAPRIQAQELQGPVGASFPHDHHLAIHGTSLYTQHIMCWCNPMV